MNAYLLGVIGTVLLCAVLTAIVPDGKTSAVIKGVAKLACLLAIVAPVLEFFQKEKSETEVNENSALIFSETGIELDEAFIKYYSEMRIRETETAIEEELLEKYAAQTDVTLEWETVAETVSDLYTSEKIKITRIRLRLIDASEEVGEMIAEHVKNNYCSEVLLE